MRRNTEIQVYAKEEILREIDDFIKSDVMSTELIGNGPLYVKLYADTPGFKKLVDELERRKLKYEYLEVREYTKKEMNETEFFELLVPFPWESDGKTADEFGTQYKRSCSSCNSAKIQISDLKTNTKKLEKYVIATTLPEIVISERLRILLEENHITGYELRPVIDYKGRSEPVFYQLAITSVLPEMSKEIRTENDENLLCKDCGRNGLYIRSEAVYERQKLKKACDFNLTREYFGTRMYCRQHYIISAKLYHLFKQNKIKRVNFDPVRIIG